MQVFRPTDSGSINFMAMNGKAGIYIFIFASCEPLVKFIGVKCAHMIWYDTGFY